MNTNEKWRKDRGFFPNTSERPNVSFHRPRQEHGRERENGSSYSPGSPSQYNLGFLIPDLEFSLYSKSCHQSGNLSVKVPSKYSQLQWCLSALQIQKHFLWSYVKLGLHVSEILNFQSYSFTITSCFTSSYAFLHIMLLLALVDT